jgi:DNA-binding response OmpR family regulator
MKVLIVEDDKHLAETIKSNLVSENYVVEIAKTTSAEFPF